MSRFLVIDRTGLGRTALNAALEREDTLPEPVAIATPYGAVVADTCLADSEDGSRIAEVQAPDFLRLACRLAH